MAAPQHVGVRSVGEEEPDYVPGTLGEEKGRTAGQRCPDSQEHRTSSMNSNAMESSLPLGCYLLHTSTLPLPDLGRMNGRVGGSSNWEGAFQTHIVSDAKREGHAARKLP